MDQDQLWRWEDAIEHEDPVCRATHESGHAVAALVLRIPFECIELDHHSDRLGRVRFFFHCGDSTAAAVRADPELYARVPTMALSGVAAEARYRGDTDRSPLTYGSGADDLRCLYAILEAQGKAPADPEHGVQRVLQEASDLVNRHWSAIERLAHQLVAEGTLTEDESRNVAFPSGTIPFRSSR